MFELINDVALLGARLIPRPLAWVALAGGCVLVAAAVLDLPPSTVLRLAAISFTDPDPDGPDTEAG